MNVLFFGSTSDSVIVLNALSNLQLVAVVTQPPRPVGREQIITPTPVETWAKEHGVTVLSFQSNTGKPWLYENEQQVIDALSALKADLIVTACYGQKIPTHTIVSAKYRGLNVHPSLLPRWRGADPVPWAILTGDHQVGVSVVTLAEEFDRGLVLAQKKIPVTDKDFSDPLRTKLFTIGADLLVEVLSDYLSHPASLSSPTRSGIDSRFRGNDKKTLQSPTPYARRMTRDDGFEAWETIQNAIATGADAARIERKLRALTPWPGLWTKIQAQNEEKRLKILKVHLAPHPQLVLDEVQLEGKTPVSFSQFQKAYLPS